MNIKFKHIVLHNFMSYGHSEIDLSDRGYVLVSGRNENPVDNASSNGSGKTAIFSAINWALTGDTGRGGSSDIRNINADDGAYVELEFSVDNTNYLLIRSKEHSVYKTNLKIYINGEDKSGKGIKDSNKLLKEYLPDFNSILLNSVIILGQGLPQRFTNNTASGRKDVLEQLSKSDFMIEDLKKRIMQRAKTLSDTERDISMIIVSDSRALDIKNRELTDITTQLSQLSSDEENNSKLESIENELNQTLSLLDENNVIKTQIEETLSEEKDKKATLLTQESDSLTQSTGTLVEEKNSIEKLLLENKFNSTALSKKIKELEAVSDICPTCGQKLHGVTKPDTSTLKTQLEDISKTIDNLNSKLNEINTSLSEKQSEIRAKYSQLKEINQDTITKLTDKLSSINLKLTELNSTQLKLNQVKLDILYEIKNKTNLKSTLEKKTEQLQAEIKELEASILYNNISKDNITKHQSIINKFQTIIARDFRGYLLSNVIEIINSKAKDYCKDIFNSDAIDFKLEGNDINIYYANKLYEDLSGGEKQKVDLIVQFSIRDMLCKFLNFSCNILSIDEAFDNLDDIGCEKVLNMISHRLNDISSVYIITHHSDIELPVDDEIIVVKDSKGFSRIV